MELLDEETVHEQFPPRAKVNDMGGSRTSDGEQENAREALHAATLSGTNFVASEKRSFGPAWLNTQPTENIAAPR